LTTYEKSKLVQSLSELKSQNLLSKFMVGNERQAVLGVEERNMSIKKKTKPRFKHVLEWRIAKKSGP